MYKSILVALDGSQTSNHAMSEAVKMACLMHSTIHAVYVVDKTPLFSYAGYYDPIALVDALRKDGRAALERAEAACREAGIKCEAQLIENTNLGALLD